VEDYIMEDRRKHQRYGCSGNRRFVAKYMNEDRMLGEVRDFSRSGISFSSQDLILAESQINLDLQISGLEKKIPAGIQIVWSKQNPHGYTYGAKLTSIDVESKIEILDLLYEDWRKIVKAEALTG
jgi:hypothetical protein